MPAPRVILVEYCMAPDVTLLFIGREDMDEPEVVSVELARDELRQFVQEHFGGQSRVSKLDAGAEAEFHQRLAPLIRRLVSWANAEDIIWFVPHDVLHYLPLHAVSIDDAPLIERNPVCYTPSASVMKYCKAKPRRDQPTIAYILGDSRGDLPYAHVEAHVLAALCQTEPSVGESVSRACVLQRLQDPDSFDVLHVACHGVFDLQDALRSGWLLSKGPDSFSDGSSADDRITCKDLVQLSLRANLVTLSACESGLSEMFRAERSAATGNQRLATICQYQLVLAQSRANQRYEAEQSRRDELPCGQAVPVGIPLPLGRLVRYWRCECHACDRRRSRP